MEALLNSFSLVRKVSCLIAFALVFISSASIAGEVAGTVSLATGTVTATSVSGESRALTKGSEVFAGDRIATASKSICSLKMIDDGKIIMRENSEIVVEEYSFKGQDDDSGVIELVKGGFRGLTGIIGKTDHDAYTVKSDVAVLGIRGTDYILVKE